MALTKTEIGLNDVSQMYISFLNAQQLQLEKLDLMCKILICIQGKLECRISSCVFRTTNIIKGSSIKATDVLGILRLQI